MTEIYHIGPLTTTRYPAIEGGQSASTKHTQNFLNVLNEIIVALKVIIQ